MAAGSLSLMNAHRVSPPDDADFYPTAPWGGRAGGELVRQLDPAAIDAWECACGAGHLAFALEDYFKPVWTSDAYDYGQATRYDFADGDAPPFRADWIITNPPFNRADRFVQRAQQLAGRGVAMLMRAAALETVGRYPVMFGSAPLSVFAPFSERLPLHKGRWDPNGSTAAFYAWFIWLNPRVARVRSDGPLIMPIPPGTRARLSRKSDLKTWGVG